MIEEYKADILGHFQIQRYDKHRIGGAVTVDGLPARKVVTVFDRRNMKWIGATMSDPITGKWEMVGLPPLPDKSLLVVALDTTGTYNAEVADYITPVADTVTPVTE